MDVAKLLLENAERLSAKPAFIFKDQPITFPKLKDISFQLTDSLLKLGIQKNDAIAIYLPNTPEYIYSYLAIWCAGAISVPLDFMLTEEEVISCLAHCQAKVLFAKSKPNFSFTKVKDKCPHLEKIILVGENFVSDLSFEELLNQGENKIPATNIQDKDYAIIFYTSGTTGKPKGVLISYPQLAAAPKSMQFFVDLNERDITVCAVPLSHLGGLVYLQDNIAYGLTVVLMERFIPLEFLKNVQNYKATCFWIVPSMYYAILQLKEFETFDLSHLRWIVSFGASSSADALRRFNHYCPKAHLLNGWGMTETNGPTVVLPLGSKKIESVGVPAPWVEVKIFDDNDQELPQGRIGEIVVRSWIVTDGYYKDPEGTAQAIRNGWVHTGDLGRFDLDGLLYIVGRIKEMIKVGGEIVFEPEVEATLHKHPDVAEAAVIGVADELRGEVPKAFLVLKEGKTLSAEDLRYFCRQHLAHFKIPHDFEFRAALAKTRSGKVDKEALRNQRI